MYTTTTLLARVVVVFFLVIGAVCSNANGVHAATTYAKVQDVTWTKTIATEPGESMTDIRNGGKVGRSGTGLFQRGTGLTSGPSLSWVLCILLILAAGVQSVSGNLRGLFQEAPATVTSPGSVLGLQRSFTVNRRVAKLEGEPNAASGQDDQIQGSVLGLQRRTKLQKAILKETEDEDDAALASEPISSGSLLGLQRGMKVEKVAMKLDEDDDETLVPPHGDASTLGIQRATRVYKADLPEIDDVAGPQDGSETELPSESDNNIGSSVLGLQRSTQRRKVVISDSD